jgi:hypothetical protein
LVELQRRSARDDHADQRIVAVALLTAQETRSRSILALDQPDDLRGEVIQRVRRLLSKAPFEAKNRHQQYHARSIDFLPVQASAQNVAVFEAISRALAGGSTTQVIMNLILNSMDAMLAMPSGQA